MRLSLKVIKTSAHVPQTVKLLPNVRTDLIFYSDELHPGYIGHRIIILLSTFKCCFAYLFFRKVSYDNVLGLPCGFACNLDPE